MSPAPRKNRAVAARLVSAVSLRHAAAVKTVEIPETLFRDASAAASERGVSLKEFLANAVRAQIGDRRSRKRWPVPPPKVSKAESQGVEKRVAQEFGRIEEENWK